VAANGTSLSILLQTFVVNQFWRIFYVGKITQPREYDGTFYIHLQSVMGTNSFNRYIVTVSGTSLVTIVTNGHLQ
jgi:hypothetical protein